MFEASWPHLLPGGAAGLYTESQTRPEEPSWNVAVV